MVEDATSLVTREKSFVEITYEHPWRFNGMADVHKMRPEVGALGRVGAYINTSANGGGTATTNSEG